MKKEIFFILSYFTFFFFFFSSCFTSKIFARFYTIVIKCMPTRSCKAWCFAAVCLQLQASDVRIDRRTERGTWIEGPSRSWFRDSQDQDSPSFMKHGKLDDRYLEDLASATCRRRYVSCLEKWVRWSVNKVVALEYHLIIVHQNFDL